MERADVHVNRLEESPGLSWHARTAGLEVGRLPEGRVVRSAAAGVDPVAVQEGNRPVASSEPTADPAVNSLKPPGSFAFATVIALDSAALPQPAGTPAGTLNFALSDAGSSTSICLRLSWPRRRPPGRLRSPGHPNRHSPGRHVVVAGGDHSEDRTAEFVGCVRVGPWPAQLNGHADMRRTVALRDLHGHGAGGAAERTRRGLSRLTSLTQWVPLAGERTVEVSFRYWAERRWWWSSSTPLESTTESVRETTL